MTNSYILFFDYWVKWLHYHRRVQVLLPAIIKPCLLTCLNFSSFESLHHIWWMWRRGKAGDRSERHKWELDAGGDDADSPIRSWALAIRSISRIGILLYCTEKSLQFYFKIFMHDLPIDWFCLLNCSSNVYSSCLLRRTFISK